MEGTFSSSDLAPIDTDNWVVRVVVVPGDFWSNGRITYPEYDEVISRYGYLEPEVNRENPVDRR